MICSKNFCRIVSKERPIRIFLQTEANNDLCFISSHTYPILDLGLGKPKTLNTEHAPFLDSNTGGTISFRVGAQFHGSIARPSSSSKPRKTPSDLSTPQLDQTAQHHFSYILKEQRLDAR